MTNKNLLYKKINKIKFKISKKNRNWQGKQDLKKRAIIQENVIIYNLLSVCSPDVFKEFNKRFIKGL